MLVAQNDIIHANVLEDPGGPADSCGTRIAALTDLSGNFVDGQKTYAKRIENANGLMMLKTRVDKNGEQ
jgi:hypothetical protein